MKMSGTHLKSKMASSEAEKILLLSSNPRGEEKPFQGTGEGTIGVER